MTTSKQESKSVDELAKEYSFTTGGKWAHSLLPGEVLRSMQKAFKAGYASRDEEVKALEVRLRNSEEKHADWKNMAESLSSKLQTANDRLKIAIYGLQICSGGDLASGEGIYKAEIANECLTKIQALSETSKELRERE